MLKSSIIILVLSMTGLGCINESVPAGESTLSVTVNGKAVEFSNVRCNSYFNFSLSATSADYKLFMGFNSVGRDTYYWQQEGAWNGNMVPYLRLGSNSTMIDSVGECIITDSDAATRNFKGTFRCAVYHDAAKESVSVVIGTMNIYYTRSG
jgi:hypothetical protein